MAIIYKATCLNSGDGWKDPDRKGDVWFVYGRTMPKPYAPGQHPRVGCTIWSIRFDDGQWEKSRATWREFIGLLPTIYCDWTRP